MNVLAFDTCLGACSAAVQWRETAASRTRTAHRYEEMTTGHAERLMPMLDEVLRESGLALASLEAIVVTEGPGTFTGIRVGVAAARGLALATGLPVRAATSLHAMAHAALADLAETPAGHVLAVCVDARAGQVFVQLFEADSAEPVSDAAIMAPEAAATLSPGAALICIGSGGAAVAEAARLAGRDVQCRLPGLQPDAGSLARLAPALAIRRPLVPLYLRQPDAKPQSGRSLPRAC